jgi:hypothetical protein
MSISVRAHNQVPMLTLVILATWKAEIRRIRI